MLKTVFIGSRNEFNQVLVHWLSQRVDLCGVVWTQSTRWQRTWKGRWTRARKRMRRYGVLKVVNEALCFLYIHRFLNHAAEEALATMVIQPYQAEHGRTMWQGDQIQADSINHPDVLAFVRERQPDLAFAMCINEFFGEALRSIPEHGIFLWHEGVTPEYKGLYSTFWALHNLDFDHIGYTLLRMNDTYDAGEIFVQGRATGYDPFRHNNGFIGHKAIFDSLSEVEQFLTALEAGQANPIERSEAVSGYYTYPGLTDLMRQRLRLRAFRRSLEKNKMTDNQVLNV